MEFPSCSWKSLSLVLLLVVVSLVGLGSAQDVFQDQVQIDDLISSLKVEGDHGQDIGGEPLLRKVRQAESPPPKAEAEDEGDLNLAEEWDEDYPIVFNIILFLAITLILALIAISVAISTMDPGRDSLIYRVTSAQRLKKDN